MTKRSRKLIGRYTAALMAFFMLMLGMHTPVMAGNYHLHCDSTKPAAIRQFDQKALQDFKNKRAFQYDRLRNAFNLREWLIKQLEKLWNKIFHRPLGAALASKGLKYFIYILIGFAVLLIIIQLLRLGNVFSRRKGKIKLNYQEIEEDINEMKFEDLIRDALQKGNYRYAIRLHYLRTLKDLSDRNLIKWKPEKTNLEYMREMRRHQHGDAFEQLTDIFDWVWYGEFEVNESNYRTLQEPFDLLHQKLKVN
jgi:hypothetical protein